MTERGRWQRAFPKLKRGQLAWAWSPVLGRVCAHAAGWPFRLWEDIRYWSIPVTPPKPPRKRRRRVRAARTP